MLCGRGQGTRRAVIGGVLVSYSMKCELVHRRSMLHQPLRHRERYLVCHVLELVVMLWKFHMMISSTGCMSDQSTRCLILGVCH